MCSQNGPDKFPYSEIAEANVTLREKNHYWPPGSRNYAKNMSMAISPIVEKLGVASSKVIVKSQEADTSSSQHVQQISLSTILQV